MKLPKEIEFKYEVPRTALGPFHKAFDYKPPYMARGYDSFYGNSTNPNCFIRHRKGADINQLTLKRKLQEKHNSIRVEHNIELDSEVTPEQVRYLCKELGYRYNTSIYKVAYIFKKKTHTVVFYTCLKDRTSAKAKNFIEIEMSESYPWKNDSHAYNELCKLEKRYSKKLKWVNKNNRVSKSLWEIFKKKI